MQARIENPAMAVRGALQAILALNASAENVGAVPPSTLGLVYMRAS